MFIAGFGVALLSGTFVSGQQTQTGPPAQPTPSIYNRMRRFPPQTPGDNQQNPQQQQTTQTQQFPNPAQQFPPEQQGVPGQRPPIALPHATAPNQAQASLPLEHGIAPANPQTSAPQPPTSPYGLALQPANPPRIGYAGGQLTVSADNSSLTDILNSVGRITGAHIEGNHADSERVFGEFGPGRPRDVLNSLLSGSRYDYILVGAIDDPGDIKQVMLSPHGSSLEGAATASKQAAGQPNSPQVEQDNDEAVVAPQPIVEPPQPQVQVTTPTEQAPPNQQQVKTPEQLLQELQRLRQQQQQQQQQTPR